MAKIGASRGQAKIWGQSHCGQACDSAHNCVAEQRVSVVRAGRPRSASIRLDVRRPYDCGENVVTFVQRSAEVVREPPPMRKSEFARFRRTTEKGPRGLAGAFPSRQTREPSTLKCRQNL